MSHEVPVNNFEWIEDTSQFNEDFEEFISSIKSWINFEKSS